MTIDILFYLFFICAGLQTGYALFFLAGIFKLKQQQPASPGLKQPISVIICAKNEYANLSKNLSLVLQQAYYDTDGRPLFEVIVVDDASTDQSGALLKGWAAAYPHLKVVTVTSEMKRRFPGKKFALSLGVEQAKYSLLLLTDADCNPASAYWLECMAEPLLKGQSISAGYGAYLPSHGFLNKFIRWETLHTFMQYSTYSLAGMPYMAVGRNLACIKEVFTHASRSDIWSKLPSGDDDLLMREIANGKNTAIVCQPVSFTYTEARQDFGDWLRQKQRHISTGKYYKLHIKLLLGTYALSHACNWLLLIILLFTPFAALALAIMSVRCTFVWFSWWNAAILLKEKKLVTIFPLLDIAWAVYNFILSPYIFWKNKQQWM